MIIRGYVISDFYGDPERRKNHEVSKVKIEKRRLDHRLKVQRKSPAKTNNGPGAGKISDKLDKEKMDWTLWLQDCCRFWRRCSTEMCQSVSN